MLYTTHYANLRNLPSHIVPVSISIWPPKWWDGLVYHALAPTADMVKTYKADGSVDNMVSRYVYAVLRDLRACNVVHELVALAGSSDIVLVCYEKPEDFCHRDIVRCWLNDNGFVCTEYGRASHQTKVKGE